MRGWLVLALLAAGCASRPPEPPVLEIEADRARVVLPARGESPEGRSRAVAFEGTLVRTRESDLEVERAGEDFSVVAEGGVRLLRRLGTRLFEEGPYRVVILRNGSLLTR